MLLRAFGLAPRWLKDQILLRSVRLDPAEYRGIVVKLAETEAELTGAARLVHDAYVRRGILEAHASGLEFHAQAVVPTSLTFVAKRGEEVVGTVSLIVDSPAGIPMEETYAAEIDQLRVQGVRFAEVSSLAVHDSARRTGVFYLLNRIMVRAALTLGLDKIVIAVHPRSKPLYEAAMLMEEIGPMRSYKGLNKSALAVALSLSLESLEERSFQRFGHLKPVPANPHYLHFKMEIPEIEQPTLAKLLPNEQRSDAYAALARARMGVFRKLTATRLAYLRETLSGVLWPSPSSFDLERYAPVNGTLSLGNA